MHPPRCAEYAAEIECKYYLLFEAFFGGMGMDGWWLFVLELGCLEMIQSRLLIEKYPIFKKHVWKNKFPITLAIIAL